MAKLSYSVFNRGGMASTGRTLVIAVPAPEKVTSSTCKSIGSGKYECTLGTIAAGKTVVAAITVAVPRHPRRSLLRGRDGDSRGRWRRC